MPDIEAIVRHEASRVTALMATAAEDIEADGGDIRAFAAALLTAAIQLHAEVEGTAGLASAITMLARRELVAAGHAGSA